MARKGIGALRRGQVVSSFGPGATIDLPEHSVIIGGLDWWRGWDRTQVVEPRLEQKAAEALGVPRLRLYAPPAEETDPGSPTVGIGVEVFPLWFVSDYEEARGSMRSRPLVHQRLLSDGRRHEMNGQKYAVTPVRFVQACPNGHIADIEWWEFAHGGKTTCRRQLWLDETGSSGDLTTSRCAATADCRLERLRRRSDPTSSVSARVSGRGSPSARSAEARTEPHR